MLTRLEILQEYTKCISDPIYAIENYLKTFDKTQSGFVPFLLFPRQKDVINSYELHRYNLVTKPRQAGVSTTTAAYWAIKCCFGDPNNPEKVLILANKQVMAQEFLGKIKDFITQVPRWVWGDEYYGSPEKEKKDIFLVNSKGHIILPNKCEIKAVATSKDALRGFTPSVLIMDEAAFIDNGEIVFNAALTSLGCLTKDSLILTENGLVELDELVKEKEKIGFTNLENPHKICNMVGDIVDATQTFVSEYGETYKIKTKLGIELEGSWKHPILLKTSNGDEWVTMNQLKIGDNPIISYNQNIFGCNDYIIKDSDYVYPSNELLKANKGVILEYINGLYGNSDYFISYSNETLRRIQILLLNLGFISVIDGNQLVRLKFDNNELFKNNFIDEIVSIEKSEDYTYDLHVPETNSFISNGFISHNTGGKATLISCVTKDTFIISDEGIKQVGDFIYDYMPENVGYKVDDYNILGKGKLRNSNIIVNNGLQDTVKLRTTSSELECSKTHILWGYSKKLNKFGWLNSDYLEIGDSINIQYGMNVWGNDISIEHQYIFSNKEDKPDIIYDKITSDLAYLIGLYLSQGSTYKTYSNDNLIGTSITFTCDDYIGDIINKCGFSYSSYDKLHYTVSSKYLGSLFESLGLDLSLKAPDKYIPSKLLKLPKDIMTSLIQGIMDGNGYSDKSRLRIGISLSSEKMIKQLRIIFNNFGILTDYQTGVTPPTKKVKVSSDYYKISATSVNALKYYNEIGFRFKRKQIKDRWLKNNFKFSQLEYIPNGKKIIRDIIDDNNLTRKIKKYGLDISKLRYSNHKTSRLNRNTFSEYINVFTNVLFLDLNKYNIDKILIPNCKWEYITLKEYSENYVYDFSLPNVKDDFWSHSVIYNGILGHQTPNGQDALYYTTYAGAKEKKNDFNIIEMRWYEDLRYNKDLKWIKEDKETNEVTTIIEEDFTFESYNQKIKDGYKPTSSWYIDMCRNMNNNSRMIAQELDVSFVGSGGNVIDDEYITFQEENNVMEPKFISGPQKEFWIWEEPKEGHRYFAGVDVSRGDGEDSSTIVIIDFTTMEQVMEYKGKTPPDILANIVYEYCTHYNAYTVIDITGGMGATTVLKLLELNFPQKLLHYDDPKGKVLQSASQLEKYVKYDNKIPGFTVGNSRLPLVANLERNIRDNIIKVRSNRMTNEMRTFVYKNGRPDHQSGFHDDLLMALGMALWVLEHSFKNLEKLEKQTKAMLDSWSIGSTTEEESTGGFVPRGMKGTSLPKPKFNHNISKTIQDPKGDYLWLFSGMR